MRILRGLGALTKAYLLEISRSKTVIFWSLAFPLLFVLGFGYIFGRGQAEGVAYVLPGILTINLIAAAFFGLAMNMVALRENGVFRRYRVTPVSALTVVTAHALTSLSMILASMLVQLIVAKLVFGITIKGSLFLLAVALLLSAFAFIPLGLLVGSTAKDTKTAPAVNNLIFFPMMFLSGAALPLFMMPDWMKSLAHFLPATYVVEILQGIIFRGLGFTKLALPAAVLVLTGLLGFGLNSLLFRWESSEPIRKKNLFIAVGSILAIYLLVFLFSPGLTSAEKPVSSESRGSREETGVTVLRGMTIIDGLGKRISPGRIVLEGNRIRSAGADDQSPIPEGARVEDLSGKYVIPGMIDSHVHIGGSAGGSASLEEFMPARVRHDLQVYLALGITAIVSLTDDPADMGSLRRAVDAGEMRAPHVFFSGPSITAPGGHPASRFQYVPGLAEKLTRQISTAAEALQTIGELADMKVDLVKLVLEDGWGGQTLPRLSGEALREAVSAAREMGLRTTVHVHSDANARLAIATGVDGLEHVPGDLSDGTIKLLAEKGITLTPTLAVLEGFYTAASRLAISDTLVTKWCDPGVLASLASPNSWIARAAQSPEFSRMMLEDFQNGAEALRRAQQGGVTILAGSDAGNPATFHGPGLIRELELLVEKGGMSPAAALRSATGRAADRLGKAQLGRIAAGASADLVVLSADPEADIRAIRRVQAVYFRGKKLDRANLLTDSPGDWQPGG